MIIHSAEFVASFAEIEQCPKGDIPEIAFIGRSNVGKSSLINMITNQKKLAKTSGTPGKTRLMNFFLVNKKWHLVDLPGYGYAKVSKHDRKQFLGRIKHYLDDRKQLLCTFLLIDSGIPPQKSDLEFANLMGSRGVPFVLVFTKTDKRKNQKMNRKAFREVFLESWEELPQTFITSTKTRTGKDQILQFLGELTNANSFN